MTDENNLIEGNLRIITSGDPSVHGDGTLRIASNFVVDAGYIELNDISAPSAPGAGTGRLYKKTGDDGCFWNPDGAGPEVDLTARTVIVKEDGATVTGGPHEVLNFIGTRITATDAGSNTANITVAMPTTSKGDLMVHDNTDDTRLPVGADNYVLTADSTQSTGLRWRPLNGQLAEDLQGVNSTTLASTSSSTYVDIPNMSITVSNSGIANYLIIYSQVAYTSNASSNNIYYVILNVDGVDVAVTERTERPVNSNSDFIITTSHYVENVADGSIIKMRWRKDGNMTIYSKNRELCIAGFAPLS